MLFSIVLNNYCKHDNYSTHRILPLLSIVLFIVFLKIIKFVKDNLHWFTLKCKNNLIVLNHELIAKMYISSI